MTKMLSNLVDTRDETQADIPVVEAIKKSQPQETGGLYTVAPGMFPSVSDRELGQMPTESYQDSAETVLGKYDLQTRKEGDLRSLIDAAYGSQWHREEITPLSVLNEKQNLYLLELGHGPNFVFKNVALEFLSRYLDYINDEQKVLRALGASSGDTIHAAHNSVRGMENLQSIFLLPQEGPSKVQFLQSMAHGIKNAMTLLMDEKFDAGQAMIKEFNTEKYAEFKEENNFVSFNSIQILRVIAQVVYYFRAYAQLVDMGKIKMGDEVDFSVPSGNFGDALAGRFAKEMGLPIRKINVATNKNNILEEFIRTGVYRRRRNPDGTFATSMTSDAPSQDIDVSSNFERDLYLACNGDAAKVKSWMKDLKDPKKGFFKVDSETLKNIRVLYTGSKAEDKDIQSTQRWAWNECSRIIDPHTATGVYPFVNETRDIPMVCLSTSHSVQFDLIKGIDPNATEYHEYDQYIKPLQDRMDNGKVIEGEHFLKVGKVTPEDLQETVQEAVSILNKRCAA